MEIIKINNLTKDYGNGNGIFNVNISVNQGEVYGFLGPNGAGKTTTIRHLLGFIKSQKGDCFINNMDCWKNASDIQNNLGYLPGEIAFIDNMTGMQMIHFIAELKGMHDMSKAHELMERFELNPKGSIRKMSKGMKQKVGLICAFMNDPDVIILDEPTSGLDPLMQNRFIDLILEEKTKGKTIFMSSHMFEEIEKTCDRTAIIKDGKIIAIEDMKSLKDKKSKYYTITFKNIEDAKNFSKLNHNIVLTNENIVKISVKSQSNISKLLNDISRFDISDLDIEAQNLEELFLHFYGGK